MHATASTLLIFMISNYLSPLFLHQLQRLVLHKILQAIDLLEIKHFDSSKSLLLQRSSSRMIFRIKVKTTQLLLFTELLFTVVLCFYSVMYTLMFGFVMGGRL